MKGQSFTSVAVFTASEAILTSPSSLPKHVSLEPLSKFQALCYGCPIKAEESIATEEVLRETFRSARVESPPPGRPGRKVSTINSTLRLFIRNVATLRESKPPKLENIRYRTIRTLKKTLRRLFDRKAMQKTGLLAIDQTHPETASKVALFKSYAKSNRLILAPFSDLTTGPKVDRIRHPNPTPFSTYNNEYMNHIFQTSQIRQIYRYFVSVIFSNSESSSLCRRFGMNCCADDNHQPGCREKWRLFEKMMEEFLGAKIDSS